MHFKQFQCRAPVQWNVHLKLSVLCVIAIWHISVRVNRVVLFLMNSKLKYDCFVEIKCFFYIATVLLFYPLVTLLHCYLQQMKTFILLVNYDAIIFCLLSIVCMV